MESLWPSRTCSFSAAMAAIASVLLRNSTKPKPMDSVPPEFLGSGFVFTHAERKPFIGLNSSVNVAVVVVKFRFRTKSVDVTASVSSVVWAGSSKSVTETFGSLPNATTADIFGASTILGVKPSMNRPFGAFSRKSTVSLKRL